MVVMSVSVCVCVCDGDGDKKLRMCSTVEEERYRDKKRKLVHN